MRALCVRLAADRRTDGRTDGKSIAHPKLRRLPTLTTTGPVIDYEELHASNLPIHDRIALWLASDVLVISAIRCVGFISRDVDV